MEVGDGGGDWDRAEVRDVVVDAEVEAALHGPGGHGEKAAVESDGSASDAPHAKNKTKYNQLSNSCCFNGAFCTNVFCTDCLCDFECSSDN